MRIKRSNENFEGLPLNTLLGDWFIEVWHELLVNESDKPGAKAKSVGFFTDSTLAFAFGESLGHDYQLLTVAERKVLVHNDFSNGASVWGLAIPSTPIILRSAESGSNEEDVQEQLKKGFLSAMSPAKKKILGLES